MVGIDSGRFKDALFDAERVMRHINRAREIRGLENAGVIVAAESNLGRESGWLFSYLRDQGLRDFLMLTDTQGYRGGLGARAGMTTRNDTKYNMTRNMFNLLQTKSIRFLREGVCITPKKTYASSRAQVIQQLHNWMQIGEDAKHEGGVGKVRYDGKSGGKSDDLAFAIMQCGLAKQNFYLFEETFRKPGPFNFLRQSRQLTSAPRDIDFLPL